MLQTSEHYFQYIEGPIEPVQNLMANILADPRHSDVTILHQVYISSRVFPNWNMGYFNSTSELMKQLENCDPNAPMFVQMLLEFMTTLYDTA